MARTRTKACSYGLKDKYFTKWFRKLNHTAHRGQPRCSHLRCAATSRRAPNCFRNQSCFSSAARMAPLKASTTKIATLTAASIPRSARTRTTQQNQLVTKGVGFKSVVVDGFPMPISRHADAAVTPVHWVEVCSAEYEAGEACSGGSNAHVGGFRWQCV
jgi:hypothetical protein